MDDKIIGTFFGQILGDCIGARYEFLTKELATRRLRRDIRENEKFAILGGGVFGLKPGQITDDSELALMLARNMVAHPYNLSEVAKGLLRWYQSEPFDIGETTRRSFIAVLRKNEWDNVYKIMKENARIYNKNSLSNGCLMKLSPVALLGMEKDPFSKEEDHKVVTFAKKICSLTHSHPIALDACQVYILAIRDAIRGESNLAIWMNAIRNAQSELIKEILFDAASRRGPALGYDGLYKEIDGKSQGYLGIALQLAFYELLHGWSFENSIKNVIKCGGDVDSTGAITGSLLGAFYGYDAIPKEWITTVLQVDNPRVADLKEVSTDDLVELALHLASL